MELCGLYVNMLESMSQPFSCLLYIEAKARYDNTVYASTRQCASHNFSSGVAIMVRRTLEPLSHLYVGHTPVCCGYMFPSSSLASLEFMIICT